MRPWLFTLQERDIQSGQLIVMGQPGCFVAPTAYPHGCYALDGLIADVVDDKCAAGVSVGIVPPVLVQVVHRKQARLPVIGNEEHVLAK